MEERERVKRMNDRTVRVIQRLTILYYNEFVEEGDELVGEGNYYTSYFTDFIADWAREKYRVLFCRAVAGL